MKRLLLLLFVVVNMGIAVHAKPQRIAAMAPNVVELLFDIGAGDQIVATVEYADFPKAAQSILRVGRHDHIDLESLLVVNPDLIVISRVDTSPLLLEQLAKLDVPIIDASVTKLQQLPIRMKELGQLTGNQELAQQQAQLFEQRLSQLTSRYQQVDAVTVFYQVWPEPLTTVSSGWINDMISLCGGINVFAGAVAAYPQINVEQVLMANPQLILKPVHTDFENSETVNWSHWPEIDAVAHQHITSLDSDLVHRSGPRALDGLAQICVAIDSVRD